MAKYKKKPVVIDAFKWTGGPDQVEDPDWIITAIKNKKVWFGLDNENRHNTVMFINTLEGVHQANLDDYIIKGIAGEIYPCKPDIFEKTYEVV